MNTIWPFPSNAPETAPTTTGVKPGSGTRLTVNELGSALSRPSVRSTWPHSWKASLAGRVVRFRRGTIDGREPQIGGQPMSAAALVLGGTMNARSESFICAEVVPNAEGIIDDKSKLTMVEAREWRSYDEALARIAIAVVLWKSGRPYELHQIVKYDLLYQRVKGEGGVVHLFR